MERGLLVGAGGGDVVNGEAGAKVNISGGRAGSWWRRADGDIESLEEGTRRAVVVVRLHSVFKWSFGHWIIICRDMAALSVLAVAMRSSGVGMAHQFLLLLNQDNCLIEVLLQSHGCVGTAGAASHHSDIDGNGVFAGILWEWECIARDQADDQKSDKNPHDANHAASVEKQRSGHSELFSWKY